MVAREWRAIALATVLGLGTLSAGALPGLAWAQAPLPPKTGYKPPRTADGHPDLQGVWTNAAITDLPADCSGGRGVDCNYNAAWTDPGSVVMRVNGQPRNGFITTTADGRVPMRKDVHVARFGRALPAGMGASDNPETRALGERCLLSFGNSSGPVMLPGLYNNTYQFVQT